MVKRHFWKDAHLKNDYSEASTPAKSLRQISTLRKKAASCAAKAFYTALQWISHRPRSQNISKERTLNPEKDSTIKRPRSHVSSEKSSKNYKLLENWAKPNLLPDVTPQLAYSFGDCIWRVCHVVKPEPREFLAILISQINWLSRGERAGWIAVWSSSLTGW